jgi:hypothetical protein
MVYAGHSTKSTLTNSNSPPGYPPVKPEIGSYCIRATTELLNSPYTFEGYDDTLDIIKRVEDACEREQTGEYTCGKSKVVFFGPMRECAGIVYKKSSDPNVDTIVVSPNRT